MRETQWIEWTRTRLQPQEGEGLLTMLTSQQKARLLEHDYVWVEGVGVLWNSPDRDLLRRARFTHGTHFQTARGEFYIDSEGSASEISDHDSSNSRQAKAKAAAGATRAPAPGFSSTGDEHLIIREDDVPAALG